MDTSPEPHERQESRQERPAESSSSSPGSLGHRLFRKRGGFSFSSGLARLKALNEEESNMYADEASFFPLNGGVCTPGVSTTALSNKPDVGGQGKDEGLCGYSKKENERAREEDAEEAEEEEETLVVLQSMKELQKVRQSQHRRGLDIVGLQESEKSNQGGGEGEEEEDDLAGYGLLERSFSAVNTSSASGVTIDKHL